MHNSTVIIDLERNPTDTAHFDQDSIYNENLQYLKTKFLSSLENQVLEFTDVKFYDIDYKVDISVKNCMRRVRFDLCDFHNTELGLAARGFTHNGVLKAEILDSVLDLTSDVDLTLIHRVYASLMIRNVTMGNIGVHGTTHASADLSGFASKSILVENSKLTMNRPLAIFDAVVVVMKNSQFVFEKKIHCSPVCGIAVGAEHSNLPALDAMSVLTCPDWDYVMHRDIAIIQNSTFVAQTQAPLATFFTSKKMNLILENIRFQMQKSSIATALSFGKTAGKDLIFENVTVDARRSGQKLTLLFLEDGVYFESVKNLELVCPVGHDVKLRQDRSKQNYFCEKSCGSDAYTLTAGSAVLENKYSKLEIKMSFSTVCRACPVGAECDGSIKPLPNYWGFLDGSGYVNMVRCPVGYCCWDNNTCVSLNACRNGRVAAICGVCKEGFSEALFSTECVPFEECHTSLILATYLFCAACYAMALIAVSSFKSVLFEKVKAVPRKLSRFLSKKRNVALPTSDYEAPPNQALSKSVQTDDCDAAAAEEHSGSMKYIQILFYYLQDASLFTVLLPNSTEEQDKGAETDKANGDSFVDRVVQFSPGLISHIHTTVKSVCFSFSSSPVSKVMFNSFFGLAVLGVILILYVLQYFMSKLIKKKLFWTSFKVHLTRAFLLTVLFSYQKIAKGMFALVQCVSVLGLKHLLIQGNIECYTWWQRLVQCYLCFCIFPFVVVISHTVFCVKDQIMSVSQFVAACLFPVPVLTYFWTKQKCRSCSCSGPTNKHQSSQEMVEFSYPHCSRQIFFDAATQTSSDYCNYTRCEEVVVDSLLEHYKVLGVRNIRFTWLGVHKLYRLCLVAIVSVGDVLNSFTKLWVMTCLVACMLTATIVARPYKDPKANVTASLSFLANIGIALINISRSVMETFDCQTNCSKVGAVTQFLNVGEKVLLLYLPGGAMLLWICVVVVQKVGRKRV